MNWRESIDNYCERTDASFWSEPLNAITNAAFLIAAWLLWKRRTREAVQDRQVTMLTLLIAVVGVGSFSFHTFANRLTMLADVLPILVFVLCYIYCGFSRLANVRGFSLLAVYGAFFAMASMLSRVPPEWMFNGSIAYAPCLIMLLFLAWRCRACPTDICSALLKACGVFAASLTLRSLDMSWCESFPIGTHFLWHSLNGVVLYLLARSIMIQASREPSER